MKRLIKILLILILIIAMPMNILAESIDENTEENTTESTEEYSLEFMLGINETQIDYESEIPQSGIILFGCLGTLCLLIFAYMIFNIIKFKKHTQINIQNSYIKPKLIIRDGHSKSPKK